MKKFFSLSEILESKVSSRFLLASIALFFFVGAVLSATVILTTDLKTILVPDGAYFVKNAKMIPLKGNAELPLYEAALRNVEVPSGSALYIGSGFGRYLPGHPGMEDLVYYGGRFNGDFYRIDVSLMNQKIGYILLNIEASEYRMDISRNFGLLDRMEMTELAASKVADKQGLYEKRGL